MERPRSEAAFRRASERIPGGVSSPVRAFRAVGGSPLFIARGQGAWIEDVDGNRYVDFVGSWGPLILGHAHPAVVRAVQEAAAAGTSFGAPTLAEVDLAERIAAAIPSVEQVRLVNSGTEATMTALRLARAATGRQRILKFRGCYHGHSDSLLVEAGSGALTLGVPSSPGVPAALAQETSVLEYNDLEGVRAYFRERGEETAAVIVEPVAGNMGVVEPVPGFLELLREESRRAGALLIFDEVITGFRLGWGGVQSQLGVEPDLTCLGKVIGGGLPLAAVAGPRALMEQLAPAGPVYQAGTLAGNPLAVAAGLATLRELERPGVYEHLARLGERWRNGLQEAARQAGVPLTVNGRGSMSTPFFTGEPVRDLEGARRASGARYAAFFHGMLERGFYLPPSPFEANFLSTVHDERLVDLALEAAGEVLRAIARDGRG
ncbi:MAG: glutamate-1-semialdehyde 2,1-aminomutase [Clostridia bacterium]|nr:glutamate-1-semialdehyde 2,1-aminomutase [Clostridia bacterium]